MKSAIDHLVFTAPELERGSEQLSAMLGVALRPGGEHPLIGTHNRLLRLGESEYLEVVTVNPAAAPPARARWFDLDRLAPDAPVGLRGWVVRTPNLEAAVARSPVALGSIEPGMRADLRWRLTFPRDGIAPLDGLAPSLIEWSGPAHPSARLPDDGCELIALELRHPSPSEVRALLGALEIEGPIEVATGSSPSLRARIRTPHGIRELS